MVQKSKTGTKGAGKQHPGSEEFRSGSTNLQKGTGTHEGSRSSSMKKQEDETLQEPKSGQQKVKQEQASSRKKSR